MKFMKKTAAALLVVASSASFAKTQVYQGVSNLRDGNRNDCSIEITTDYQSKIQAVDYSGPVVTWEIIAETQSGYGPKKTVSYQNSDDLLSKPDIFKALNFQVSDHVFSNGYTLKSRQSIEGPLRSVVDIQFYFNNDNLVSTFIKTKFKATVVTIGSKEFECHDLKEVKTRR